MIAVLIATRSEAQHLLHSLSPVKHKGIYHYRGKLAGKQAVLFLLRPGVGSREQVRRFLRLYNTDLVIATGACASLTSELRALQIVLIGAVTNADQQWLQLQETGRKCVTVGHLVCRDEEKALLREHTGADVLDMETWTIAKILREPEFATRRFSAVRVVDDLPGDEARLNQEQKLRDLTASRASGRLRLAEIARFGIWDYFAIMWQRRRVSAAIAQAVLGVIKSRRE